MATFCNASHCTWREGTFTQLAPLDALAWRRDVRELRVKVRSSELGGLGVFAARYAGPGRWVCSYMGTILTRSQMRERYTRRGDHDWPVYVYRLGARKVIDARDSRHWSRLINHHQDPNLHAVVSTASERIDFYAKRPLQLGMELTIDYGISYWRGRTERPVAGSDSRPLHWLRVEPNESVGTVPSLTHDGDAAWVSPTVTEWWQRPFVLPPADRSSFAGENRLAGSVLQAMRRGSLSRARAELYPDGLRDAQQADRRDMSLRRALGRMTRLAGQAYVLANLRRSHWRLLLNLSGLSEPRWMSRRLLPERECEGALAPANVTSELERSHRWRILAVGGRGAGMHLHVDSPPLSSWHLQLSGRKLWRLCPSANASPQSCMQATLAPGESLFYPGTWWHETIVLEPWTLSLSRSLITPSVAAAVSRGLHGFCTEARTLLDSHERLCDALAPCLTRLAQYADE
uniref:SET domain-containing protein n=1 Tax=Haptolina brevifila TaxID=156173 RepID=A0A7S2J3H0_9EUKA|mmetsp:Transcript_76083/g.150782  ORF Transcript_76083/g.150782 Transcript_76083/m.150782 type:complete len:460 (+) Transcript_76083:188-1567(+)